MRRVNYAGTYRGNRCGVVDNRVFVSLRDIDTVLDRLNTSIKNNGYVTVSEYYTITAGETFDGDSEYGWTSLINCQITRTRYGYELQMPSPERVVDTTDHLREAYEALLEDDLSDVQYHLEQLINK